MRAKELIRLLDANALAGLNAWLEYRASGWTSIRREQLLKLANLLTTGEADAQTLGPKVLGKNAKGPTMRYLLSDLCSLLEDYLIANLTKENPELKGLALLRASKRDGHAFQTCLNRLAALQRAMPLSSDLPLLSYQLAWEQLDHVAAQGQRSSEALGHTIDQLDCFYRTKKLQLACEAVNASRVFAQTPQMRDLDALMQAIDPNDVLAQCYRHAMLSMTANDHETHFGQLRKMLSDHGSAILPSELRDLYQYVLNYSIRQVNQGNLGHQRELFNTYVQLIGSGALTARAGLSPWDFKNVVTISIRVGEAEFARQFIDTHATHLPEARRVNAVRYNTAHLAYATGQFRQALGLLRQVDLDDPFYKLDARAILLKVFVAMDDHVALFHHINAFMAFLRRDREVSAHQQRAYINTLKAVRTHAEWGHDRKRMVALRQKLEKTEPLADKAWLMGLVEM